MSGTTIIAKISMSLRVNKYFLLYGYFFAWIISACFAQSGMTFVSLHTCIMIYKLCTVKPVLKAATQKDTKQRS